MEVRNPFLPQKLEKHKQDLLIHFEKASQFMVTCQIIEPYVEKGMLHGCVCPWEISESADEGAFPILEDYHDTLEAIWVWLYYTEASRKQTFKPNIDWAWQYIVKNWKRFIGNREAGNKSLYDCSYVLFSGTLYEKAFNDTQYNRLIIQAGNRLENYLSMLKSTEAREYSDPFWMTYCLCLAAKSMKRRKWLETAETFMEKAIANRKNPFSRVEKEPRHKGPGGHDFFSKNANKALALISCLGQEKTTKDILLKKFLPCIPKKFVSRHADENAWNAHLATAVGKSYAFTRNKEFVYRYFAFIDELKARDLKQSAALSRSPSFPRRESWVTFFYAHAYAAVL